MLFIICLFPLFSFSTLLFFDNTFLFSFSKLLFVSLLHFQLHKLCPDAQTRTDLPTYSDCTYSVSMCLNSCPVFSSSSSTSSSWQSFIFVVLQPVLSIVFYSLWACAVTMIHHVNGTSIMTYYRPHLSPKKSMFCWLRVCTCFKGSKFLAFKHCSTGTYQNWIWTKGRWGGGQPRII